MTRKALKNRLDLKAHSINHKKMYKSRKRWIIAGISLLLATGFGASTKTHPVHASNNQDLNNRRVIRHSPKQNINRQHNLHFMSRKQYDMASKNSNFYTSSEKDKINAIRGRFNYLQKHERTSGNPYIVKPNLQKGIAGKIKPSYIKKTVDWVNFFRNLYGLNSVNSTQPLNDLAQYGADDSKALGKLQHGLGGMATKPSNISASDWIKGIEATMQGNLSHNTGANPQDVIEGYFTDEFNIVHNSTGHRTWMLRQSLKHTGVGVDGNYSDLGIIGDGSKASSSKLNKVSENDLINGLKGSRALTYPNSKLFPLSFAKAGLWSIHVPIAIYHNPTRMREALLHPFNNVNVKVFDDTANTNVPTHIPPTPIENGKDANNGGGFYNTINYQPDKNMIKANHKYTITITGDGIPNHQYSYSTKLFNLDDLPYYVDNHLPIPNSLIKSLHLYKAVSTKKPVGNNEQRFVSNANQQNQKNPNSQKSNNNPSKQIPNNQVGNNNPNKQVPNNQKRSFGTPKQAYVNNFRKYLNGERKYANRVNRNPKPTKTLTKTRPTKTAHQPQPQPQPTPQPTMHKENKITPHHLNTTGMNNNNGNNTGTASHAVGEFKKPNRPRPTENNNHPTKQMHQPNQIKQPVTTNKHNPTTSNHKGSELQQGHLPSNLGSPKKTKSVPTPTSNKRNNQSATVKNVNKLGIGSFHAFSNVSVTRVPMGTHFRYLRYLQPTAVYCNASLSEKSRVGTEHVGCGLPATRIERMFTTKTPYSNLSKEVYEIKLGHHYYFIDGSPMYTGNAYVQPSAGYNRPEQNVNMNIQVKKTCSLFKSRYYNSKTWIHELAKGAILHVAKVIRIGPVGYQQTRFILNNGDYVTSNQNYIRPVFGQFSK